MKEDRFLISEGSQLFLDHPSQGSYVKQKKQRFGNRCGSNQKDYDRETGAPTKYVFAMPKANNVHVYP